MLRGQQGYRGYQGHWGAPRRLEASGGNGAIRVCRGCQGYIGGWQGV